jgi:DNA-binding CsgD family transcriptional regulator
MALRRVRPLTPIEGRVAQLVAAGRTDAEVAADLGLADKTVAWHLVRAARKLGVRSRSDLAAALASRGGNPTKEER